MPWMRVGDERMDSPEFLSIGAQATCVHLWALAYCGRHESDGHISRKSLLGCSWVASSSQRSRVTSSLVRDGLWVESGDGWDIPTWADYILSRADLEERRAATAERKRRFDSKRKKKSNGVTASQPRDGNAAPGPARRARDGTSPSLTTSSSRRSADAALGTASSDELEYCDSCSAELDPARKGIDWFVNDDPNDYYVLCRRCWDESEKQKRDRNGSVGSGSDSAAHVEPDIDLGGSA